MAWRIRPAEMAYRSLLRLQMDTLPIDPLQMLQKCRNTVVYTERQMKEILDFSEAELAVYMKEKDAFTFRMADSKGLNRYIVCYASRGNQTRLRFTLAHELGHIVLGHMGKGDREEREADCFASHLLCPRPILEELLRTVALDRPMLERLFFLSKSAIRCILAGKSVPVDETIRNDLLQMYAESLGKTTDAIDQANKNPNNSNKLWRKQTKKHEPGG